MILKIVNKLPKEHRFDIGSQIIRSSLSITLNIAEGSGKHSDKDFTRFINIALGSLHETFAILDILRDNHFITKGDFELVTNKLIKIMNQLGGFKKTLKS